MPTLDLADVWSMRLRAAQLVPNGPRGSLTIRRPSIERKISRCAPSDSTREDGTAELLPLRLRTLFNSAYPLDINTGAVWAGRGFSGSAEGGGTLTFGPLTITAYPVIAFQENRSFLTRAVTLPQVSPFAYVGHEDNIDWPQRHGDDAFWSVHPGQSSVRLELAGFSVGVSTENLWIGPAQRAPLMLSSTAPGFPHVFVSTTRPHDVKVGSIEAQLFWGRLHESDYFDADDANDENLLVGVTSTFEPAFARGLYIGAHLSYHTAFDQPDWSVFDYIVKPFAGLRENPLLDNRLLGLFGRWVLPTAGFEVYAEWGREDAWGELMDLVREPDHSQAYVLGFQKLGHWNNARLRWWGELTHLQHSLTLRGGRGAVTFYTHTGIRQGYTNRGQLLGAWIGPGSDAQILGVDRVEGARMTGIAIERARFDDDAYYNQWSRFYSSNGHDVSLALWLRHSDSIGEQLRFLATGSIARRQNRNFVHFTGDQPPDIRWETNAHLDLELRWLPRMPQF